MKKGTRKQGHSKGSDNLTNPERLFCVLLQLTGNKRLSAHSAWKCAEDKIADNKAIRALKNPRILKYFSELQQLSLGSQSQVAEQAKRVIEELDIISFNDIRKYVDQMALPDDLKKSIKGIGESARAISEIGFESMGVPDTKIVNTKIKIKFHNKIAALTKLGEHHKLYTQLIEEGKITSPVRYELPDNGMSEGT